MGDFIKPVRQKVDVSEAFSELLGKRLLKDLHDDEAICPKCHGTGMMLRDNSYGLSNDPNRRIGAEMFPYKHQSITFCDNCYNGIVHICPDCGKQIPRGSLKCKCEAVQKREREKKREEYRKTLEATQKHEPDALGATFQMCYLEGYFKQRGARQ